MSPTEAITALAFQERSLPSFENLTDGATNRWILQRPAFVPNLWQLRSLLSRTRDDHLVSICVDDEIRVVRYDDGR